MAIHFPLATGIEQVLPLVIFLLVFFVLKWTRRSRVEDMDTSSDREQKPSEESMRKLLEALGLPENAVPPPFEPIKSKPRQTLTTSENFPSSSSAAPPPPPPTIQVPITQILTAPVQARGATSQRIAKISKPKATQKTILELPRGLQKLQKELHDPRLLRKGVVLREILGPPKALRGF
ncbi:MAG: hypothetical protein C5B47_00715 [Verrucomicrobia bacterium]|nr:MAG: hypothetical protein C5B47_00715 [Verrucomicrobiota bacterium]